MKKIKLTILYVDSVPSRIYLALLNKHGYEPEKILFLKFESKSSKYKLLKKCVGRSFANKIFQSVKEVRARLRKRKSSNTLTEKLLLKFGLLPTDIKPCSDVYANRIIEKLYIHSLDDSRLQHHIENSKEKTYLFTGGGILKERILSTPGTKFIHIHPGIVPEIKGADCFYWSWLLMGVAGYSVFYMNAGIDTGDVIYKKEFKPRFDGVESTCKPDQLYRAILQFYDPCLRILTFIELLNKYLENTPQDIEGFDFRTFNNVKQDPNAGRTYFFMHKVLRNFVLNKLTSVK